ncbi:hypothetical protein DL96DRAFT_1821508 [Flagelloscypha sp. PMI_526]|nr:hypothetical protein DL96DRAFT_1821508 [Flagelloscypha sp. PMI_526]
MFRASTLSLFCIFASISKAINLENSQVQMLSSSTFQELVLNQDATSFVVFITSQCGRCDRAIPELKQAALGLHPFVPTYVVPCDDSDELRELCSQQDVTSFPTVTLFPRGTKHPTITYDGELNASGLFYFASRRVPNNNKKFYQVDHVKTWVATPSDKPRAFLLNKDKRVPLLWQVIANNFDGQIDFASFYDRKGKGSKALGFDWDENNKKSILLVFDKESTEMHVYSGMMKLDSLTTFFNSVLSSSVSTANSVASTEDFTPSTEDLDIERKQEAQRMKLAHGGFQELIDFDFEDAIKQGHGADFHQKHGFGGLQELAEEQRKRRKESKQADREEL